MNKKLTNLYETLDELYLKLNTLVEGSEEAKEIERCIECVHMELDILVNAF